MLPIFLNRNTSKLERSFMFEWARGVTWIARLASDQQVGGSNPSGPVILIL